MLLSFRSLVLMCWLILLNKADFLILDHHLLLLGFLCLFKRFSDLISNLVFMSIIRSASRLQMFLLLLSRIFLPFGRLDDLSHFSINALSKGILAIRRFQLNMPQNLSMHHRRIHLATGWQDDAFALDCVGNFTFFAFWGAGAVWVFGESLVLLVLLLGDVLADGGLVLLALLVLRIPLDVSCVLRLLCSGLLDLRL